MEEVLNFQVNERQPNYILIEHDLANPELGTAQPQLVLLLTTFWQ
jgi:hypothetical protein